ncbi:MAG: hypothetical protein R6X18_14650 [Chloroflexota bacterium]
MSKQQLVLVYFGNEAAADEAVNAVKQWDKATKEIKLGAIGILVKDKDGKVKTQKVGKRNTGVGAILGVIAAVLSGGISLLGGIVGGSIIGALFHKGLGISKDQMARIDGYLNDGKAAVGVLVKAEEAEAVTTKLTELGGMAAESYEVSEEVVEEAVIAAEAEPVPQE